MLEFDLKPVLEESKVKKKKKTFSISRIAKYGRWKVVLNVFGRNFQFATMRYPNVLTFGITNETEDNFYVPFIDYDHTFYQKVLKDVKRLQNVLGLGTAYIFSSSPELEEKTIDGVVGNYHVIMLDKLTYQDHVKMLGLTCCDYPFRRIKAAHKSWVLRIYPKILRKNGRMIKGYPMLKEIVRVSPEGKRVKSLVHYTFLRKFYRIPVSKVKFDRYVNDLEIISYTTFGEDEGLISRIKELIKK